MNKYFLIVFASFIAAVGQYFLKKGAIVSSNILEIFRNHNIWIGLVFNCFAAILWIVSLSKMKLSNVYPFVFLIYILVMCEAYFLFGEKINIINLSVGSVFIILGIIILNGG